MPISKRAISALITLLGVMVALVAFAAPGTATPYTKNPSISLTDTTGCVSTTVLGKGFVANETVDLTLQSATVALTTVTADAAGNFSVKVTFPSGVLGAHTIVATGRSGDTASAGITIRDCTPPPPPPPAPSSGGLSTTGAAVIGIGSLGLIMLVVGSLLVIGARRRRVIA